jgi:hypothetical protein
VVEAFTVELFAAIVAGDPNTESAQDQGKEWRSSVMCVARGESESGGPHCTNYLTQNR